ncbi:ATP-binding protein [Bacteroides xylanisolvens]|uniref:ATP-binding protein n=1 Tax=Bacteroides xylanisolvens TaxID=371601 RepID=UPI00216603AF|nr:ATP-binding protein [Bacteroides xylanisolvens]MCS3376820.1 ATP-binding protein [Bacteroides xylanisolvens]
MKVWSQKNLEDIRHEYIDFDGEWYLAFGRPEKSGCWIIYGKSGQGKSSFALQLARKFDEMGLRVLYLTLEMGACDDFVNSVLSVGIHSKTNNIIYSDEATITELDEYLSKQRSPDVIMIDSIQYFEQQGGSESPRNNPPAQEVSAKDICLYLACGRARGGRKNRL